MIIAVALVALAGVPAQPAAAQLLEPYSCPSGAGSGKIVNLGKSVGDVALGVYVNDKSAPEYGAYVYYVAGACVSTGTVSFAPGASFGEGPFTYGATVNPGLGTAYSVVYYPGTGAICVGTSAGLWWCSK